jgi:signal peptidase I
VRSSRLRTVLAVGSLALVWFTVGPRGLGGGVDYVVVARGTSMQPTLEVGDLVVTKPAPDYKVGDIIAVREVDGPIIVHRIIAIDEDGFRTRGDGNDFTDPDPVASEQVLGRMALRVPAVGRWMGALGRGGLMGVIVALLVFLVGLGYLRETQPKRERVRPERSPWHPSDATALQHAAIGLVVGGMVVAGAGFSAPERKPGPVAVQHVASFKTGGPAPEGPVYPDGLVPDGQPFYLELVDQARVSIAVATTGTDGQTAVTGNWKMEALLGSSAGWQRAFPMGSGELSEGRALGRLDLAEMRTVLEGFIGATGDNEGFYPVIIRATIEVRGSAAGVAYVKPMVSDLPMRFDGARFFHDKTSEPAGTTMTAEVIVPDAAAGTFALLGREIPTRALRMLAALLMVAGALVGIGSLMTPRSEAVARRREIDAQTSGTRG